MAVSLIVVLLVGSISTAYALGAPASTRAGTATATTGGGDGPEAAVAEGDGRASAATATPSGPEATSGARDSAATEAATATPEDFGYASMRVDGERARGERPVVLVRVAYEDTDFAPNHTADVYRRLVENASDYATENSQGAFTWGAPTVVGPYTVTDDPDTDWDEGRRACWWDRDVCEDRPDENRGSLFLQTALALADDDVDYSRYDANDDGRLTSSEVTVVVVGAAVPPGDGGSSRSTCAAGELTLDSVDVCLRGSSMGEGVGFGTLTHEMTHQLWAVDVYGSDCHSERATLMSCTIFGEEDNRETFHLDPWHKIQLGWAEPRIYTTDEFRTRARCLRFEPLDDAGRLETRDQRRPLILYDPDRYDTETRTGEFYVLEYRNAASFDRDLPEEGLAVWYVQTAGGKLRHIDALVRPDGPSEDDDGDLDSTPGGDDVEDGNRIRPGPNGTIDTEVPTGDDDEPLDATPTDALNFLVAPGAPARDAPRNASERGGGEFWRTSDGEARLTWFDGTPVGVPLQVVGLDSVGDLVVAFDTREMRLDAVTDDAEPGDTIRLSGLFGARYTNFSARKTVRLGGADRDALRTSGWRCGAITAAVPETVEPGRYQLWVEDPATGVASERVDLTVRTMVDTRTWEGSYRGSLDGRPVTLSVEENTDLNYLVTMTDEATGVVYRGTVPLTDRHVTEDIELASESGETVVVPRLAFDRRRFERLTGVVEREDGRHGVAFSEEWLWVESDGEPLDRSDPDRWREQWRDDFHGYLDGREATLTVTGGEHVTFGTLRPGEGYRFDVELYDAEEDVTYRGSGLVDVTSGPHGVYEMEVGRLTSSEGALRDVVFRLHTADTSYVTATALDGETDPGYGPKAERVGLQFATDWIDYRLVDALYGIEAGDVPAAAASVIGGERVNLHVGTGVIGVYTTAAGVPSGTEPAGFEDPTLHVSLSRETLDEILDSPDPMATAREAYLAGDIRIESPSLVGSVELGVLDVVVEVYRFVRGVGEFLSDLF